MNAIWKGAGPITSVLMLLLCAESVFLAQEAANRRMGTLDLMVSDTYGQTIKSFEIEIVSNDDAKNVRRVNHAGAITIPYGTYTIRGRASLHEQFERRVILNESRMLVLVAFPFVHYGESSQRQTPVLGHVENLPTSAGVNWVRIVSVFGELAREALVDAKGNFEVSEVPYGDYLILVFHDLENLRVLKFSKTVQNVDVVVNLAEAGRSLR